ncbi:MAG: phosphoglycerate mutase [Rhodospirillaceae bacterium]|jgi:broad specificity phosphatase PhoE|nr:phosphoglycerate mutase [Rhodospirillaceae bacterium]|tara:strand:+ start:3379 stop:3972 length:594 start_codon:yes stop_codon:yes gene_type:complete
MTHIALIRHGPTTWNEQKRLQGQADIPLSSNGIKRVAKWKVPNDFIDFKWFASPLSRAQKTASILGLSVETEPAIIEMDWGKWEGKTGSELREEYGEEFIRRQKKGIDLRPDDGESPRDVRARVAEWVVSVAKNDVPTGAVAHQGIIRAMVSLATGWNMINPAPEKIDWDAIQLFKIAPDGGVQIDQLNISLISDGL